MLHTVNLLRFNKRKDDALALTRKTIKAYPGATATALLREIEVQLAPPPPTLHPSPTKP
jgi:hypothetical protein